MGLGKQSTLLCRNLLHVGNPYFVYLFCVKIWHFGLETVWYCMIADNVCKAVLFSVPLVVKRKRMIK